MKNILIGKNAGKDLPEGTEGIVIIGNDITTADPTQDDCVVIGDLTKLFISKKVWKAINESLQED